MDTQTSPIAEGIYRFSTFVPDIGPTDLTFNQYLIDDEQPLLFHAGHRTTFPAPRRGHRREHPADFQGLLPHRILHDTTPAQLFAVLIASENPPVLRR